MFNTAITGLQAASTELSVISNNVANVSSIGFKSSRALFSDMYASNAAVGKAAGMGVKNAGIHQLFSQGAISMTNNGLDMAIDGHGFFGLSADGAMVYSRAGAFNTDRDGYIVNSAGHRLIGYPGNDAGGITSQPGELRINTSNMQPSQTRRASATMNLDAGNTMPALEWPAERFEFGDPEPRPETYNSLSSLSIYDSLGNPHTLTLYFVRGQEANSWQVHALVDGVTVGDSPARTLAFDDKGKIDIATAEFTLGGWQPLDALGQPNGAALQDFDVSLLNSTQFGSPFTVHTLKQDGYSAGAFSRIAIDDNGIITSYFSNGQSQALGQVALYSFPNPQGLQQLNDSVWGETASSGQPVVGAPGSGSLGTIQASAVEESNVDLTEELADLILAQRNYQANAKTIQALDTVTQAILNLR